MVLLEPVRKFRRPLNALVQFHAVNLEVFQGTVRIAALFQPELANDVLEVKSRGLGIQEINERPLGIRTGRNQLLAIVAAHIAHHLPCTLRNRPGQLTLFQLVRKIDHA